MGYPDNRIIMDIVNCHIVGTASTTDTSNTIGNYMRYDEIHSDYKSNNDIYEFMRARPHINYRYLVNPSKKLPGSIYMLDFDQKNVAPMIAQGKNDGINAAKKGEGIVFKFFMEYHEMD